MSEPARHASGCAPGQMEVVGKWGTLAASAAQWPVFLWQKREMWSVEKEARCSSTCLEEEVVPTKAVVFFFQVPM